MVLYFINTFVYFDFDMKITQNHERALVVSLRNAYCFHNTITVIDGNAPFIYINSSFNINIK